MTFPGAPIPGRFPRPGRPGFVLPGDDVSLCVETGALIHHECVPVVLPRHLVLARQLHADRFANGLREQGGVVSNGVGAVQSIAARAPAENHMHVFGL